MAFENHNWLRLLEAFGLGRGGAVDGSTALQDIVSEYATTTSYERKEVLCKEIFRRFTRDVERACEIAHVQDTEATRQAIFTAALRGISAVPGSERYFSRQLVHIMERQLGADAVREVRPFLYLRQFIYLVRNAGSRAYVEGLLDHDGRPDWLARRRGGPEDQVQAACERAFRELRAAIEKEFQNDEVQQRTDGVWDHSRLRDV